MKEVKATETLEAKIPKSENYKEIRPENDITVKESKDYWDSIFSGEKQNENNNLEFGGKYNSYEDRIGCTPRENSENGSFEGKRGESKFVPSENTEDGMKAKSKLAEYEMTGVEYKNAEPDFSKCSEATVEIDNMTEHRKDYIDRNGNYQYGNFSQADMECAKQWNDRGKDGRTDWTARNVLNWRHKNRCSWHERCDTKTMDLVPMDIHSACTHLGGVSECRVRDAQGQVRVGGDFDE